ncbi:hypothetical protein PCE1_003817 [Barthelona sp. PCE]
MQGFMEHLENSLCDVDLAFYSDVFSQSRDLDALLPAVKVLIRDRMYQNALSITSMRLANKQMLFYHCFCLFHMRNYTQAKILLLNHQNLDVIDRDLMPMGFAGFILLGKCYLMTKCVESACTCFRIAWDMEPRSVEAMKLYLQNRKIVLEVLEPNEWVRPAPLEAFNSEEEMNIGTERREKMYRRRQKTLADFSKTIGVLLDCMYLYHSGWNHICKQYIAQHSEFIGSNRAYIRIDALVSSQLNDYSHALQLLSKLNKECIDYITVVDYARSLWALQKNVMLDTLIERCVSADFDRFIRHSTLERKDFAVHTFIRPETGACLAIRHIAKDNYLQAMDILFHTNQLKPSSQSFVLLGHLLSDMDDATLAIEAFQQALLLERQSFSAHFGMAGIYATQGSSSLSLHHALQAASVRPSSITALSLAVRMLVSVVFSAPFTNNYIYPQPLIAMKKITISTIMNSLFDTICGENVDYDDTISLDTVEKCASVPLNRYNVMKTGISLMNRGISIAKSKTLRPATSWYEDDTSIAMSFIVMCFFLEDMRPCAVPLVRLALSSSELWFAVFLLVLINNHGGFAHDQKLADLRFKIATRVFEKDRKDPLASVTLEDNIE